MITATVTSKGQITIPKSVRTSLHLCTGDRVAFVIQGKNEALMTPVTKSVDEVFGRLHQPARARRSVDDMNRAIQTRLRKQQS